MMTLQDLLDLKRGDLVLCLETESNEISCNGGSFTKGKTYVVGGKYFNGCKQELAKIIKNKTDLSLAWQNLVPIKKDDQNQSNGWKHTNFVSLKDKDLTTVKILYGIEG
jgi:hypothetical protein